MDEKKGKVDEMDVELDEMDEMIKRMGDEKNDWTDGKKQEVTFTSKSMSLVTLAPPSYCTPPSTFSLTISLKLTPPSLTLTPHTPTHPTHPSLHTHTRSIIHTPAHSPTHSFTPHSVVPTHTTTVIVSDPTAPSLAIQ